MRQGGWFLIRLMFWAIVSYVGWVILWADLTDLLAAARLPYYILFNLVGLALILLGLAKIAISLREEIED